MRVNHLSLSHFRGFKELDIDFSATNLTVFIGTNGRGKSSILDLIAIHLNQFVVSLSRDFNKRYNGDSILRTKDIQNNSNLMTSEISFLISNNFFSDNSLKLWDDDTNSNKIISNILSISAANGKNSRIYEDKNAFYNSFCRKLAEGIRDDWQKQLPILVYYQANRTVYADITNRDRSPFNSMTQLLNTYQNAFVKMLNDFDDFFSWFRVEEDKENELIRSEKNFDFRNHQLEVVRLSVTQFFSFLSGDKYGNLRIERNDNLLDKGLRNKYPIRGTSADLIVEKNSEKLSLDQLSDGEKSVIILICDIARRLAIANPIEKNGDFTTVLKNGNGVVLIDEIDLHLHPLWQKEILQALVKTFPSLQFIVTTHSPYVVTHLDLDDKQVQVFSIEKDKVVPIQSKGKDLSTASFEIFGVERRPKMYQHAIDDLFREFEAEKPNLAILDKKFLALKKQLGETDPEIESAKIIIEGLKL